MHDLKKPYWAYGTDDYPFPGHDFNRDVLGPREDNLTFHSGAVGVRVDGDFWLVAALPYEKYKNVKIEDIVSEFWPDITNATFGPDSTAWAKRRD